MFIDNLCSDEELPVQSYLIELRIIKKIGQMIIDFLASMEEFQKKIWLKKKFVLSSNWCICVGLIDPKYYPQIVGLQIEIDVLGIVIFENRADLYFIEAKKTQLNLQNLGQLLIYCKLCDPEEAYLLSSAGMGSLSKVLNNLSREDLLDYGQNKKIKRIKVSKWDVVRETVDQHFLVPKI